MSESKLLFRIFLWKNWRQIRYSWISLCLIFFGCSGIFVIYLYSTNKILTTPQTTYDRRGSNDLKNEFPINDVDRIFYVPSTPQTDLLMEAVRQELQYPLEGIRFFHNETVMIRTMESSCKGNCYAVNFFNYPKDVVNEKFKYSISSTSLRISPVKRYVNDEEVAGIKGYLISKPKWMEKSFAICYFVLNIDEKTTFSLKRMMRSSIRDAYWFIVFHINNPVVEIFFYRLKVIIKKY